MSANNSIVASRSAGRVSLRSISAAAHATQRGVLLKLHTRARAKRFSAKLMALLVSLCVVRRLERDIALVAPTQKSQKRQTQKKGL